MSCGCKNVRDTSVPDAKWVNYDKKGINNHVYKWFIFFTLVLFSPLFIPVIINFLYKLIIKNEKSINTNKVFKWLIFIGMTILSPLYIPVFIYFLYVLIIKNQNLDMSETLKSIAQLIKTYMILNKKSDIDIADLEVYDENKELGLVNV